VLRITGFGPKGKFRASEFGLNEPQYLALICTTTWYWSPRSSIAITCAGSEVI